MSDSFILSHIWQVSTFDSALGKDSTKWELKHCLQLPEIFVLSQEYLYCELKFCCQRLDSNVGKTDKTEEGQIILPDKHLISILMGYLYSWEVVLMHPLSCKGKESRVSFFFC